MRTNHGAPHMVENNSEYSAIALYHCIELKPIEPRGGRFNLQAVTL